MGLADLSNVLWRVRETLDLLLFKLEEEQLVLAAGRTRWLPHATREVEVVLDQLRKTELLRATEVETVAEELGIGPEPSLNALAEAAGEPWTELFRQHRAAFLTLTAEISELAEGNRDLLLSGQRAANEALLSVSGSLQTYGPDGGTTSSPASARLVDEAM